MLSTLELRHLVEQSFLPTRCECTLAPPSALTLRFYQGASNQEMLVVCGIAIADLSSSHAIASLIVDLRKDLERINTAAHYVIKRPDNASN
jgi:hypothetical protein